MNYSNQNIRAEDLTELIEKWFHQFTPELILIPKIISIIILSVTQHRRRKLHNLLSNPLFQNQRLWRKKPEKVISRDMRTTKDKYN